MAKSNINLITHIVAYCKEIKGTINRFGDDFDTFVEDIDYRKSVCLVCSKSENWQEIFLKILEIPLNKSLGNKSEDYGISWLIHMEQ